MRHEPARQRHPEELSRRRANERVHQGFAQVGHRPGGPNSLVCGSGTTAARRANTCARERFRRRTETPKPGFPRSSELSTIWPFCHTSSEYVLGSLTRTSVLRVASQCRSGALYYRVNGRRAALARACPGAARRSCQLPMTLPYTCPRIVKRRSAGSKGEMNAPRP